MNSEPSTGLPGLPPDATQSFVWFLEQERQSPYLSHPDTSPSQNGPPLAGKYPLLSGAGDIVPIPKCPGFALWPPPECVLVFGYCDCRYHKTAAWLNEYYPIEEHADKLAEWTAWHAAERQDAWAKREAAKAHFLGQYIRDFEVALGVVGYAMDMSGPDLLEWKDATSTTWRAKLEEWVETEEMPRYDSCQSHPYRRECIG